MHLSRRLNSQDVTHGAYIYFNEYKFAPGTPDGKHLLAHELTHVVQQKGMGKTSGLQRQSTGNTAETEQLALADPLTDQEWLRVRAWRERGAVGFDPTTADPDENAALIADAIFSPRMLI